MKRAWLAVGLLAASWLFGLRYFHAENWWAWWALLACSVGLLTGFPVRFPSRRDCIVAIVLILPAAWLAAWPYSFPLWLIAAGLALRLPPYPRQWPRDVAAAGAVSGLLLLAQAVALQLYQHVSGRTHELGGPAAKLAGAIVSLLGIDGAVHGSTVALHSMRKTHLLGATWEALFDPVTFCFWIGGAALLALHVWTHFPVKQRLKPFLTRWLILSGCLALWLPLRFGLLIAIYLHRVLRTAYEGKFELMGQFWNPWISLLLLLPLVLLALRFLPGEKRVKSKGEPVAPPPGKLALKLALAALALVFWTAALYYNPLGKRKSDKVKVLVSEYNSAWERTDRAFDTEWYGNKSAYNYFCIYEYCTHFFEMDRLTSPATTARLKDCDVLILKCPTEPYKLAEVEAILKYVEEGGGLLLVGEHTNVFHTGTNLNQIARPLGFEFRPDCLFDIDDVFHQKQHQEIVPHPIMQWRPELDFAVSCSIAPGFSRGRAAVLSTGLRSLPADYFASNFYPQVEDRPDARYGAFVQLWTTRHGKGRVAAFSDSTIFSNFSTFEPGKAELWLGLTEWLARSNSGGDPFWIFAVLGAIFLGAALKLKRDWEGGWLVLIAAGCLAWAGTCGALAQYQRTALPPLKPERPFVQVAIDRNFCETALSKSGFIGGEKGGFGIFERWILRLGYFIKRVPEGLDPNAALTVFMYPTKPVSPEYRAELLDYVKRGGKVLVLDSPQNPGSSASGILGPFGLSFSSYGTAAGTLKTDAGWPEIEIQTAFKIDQMAKNEAVKPFAWIGRDPVGAYVKHGEGMVIAIGFGHRFTDPRMGATGDIIPDKTMRDVFEVQYSLIRAIIENQPLKPEAAAQK